MAEGPISGDEIEDEFPNEHFFAINTPQWKMYFDGASNIRGNGVGVLLVDPDGVHIPFVVKLSFPTTNNAAEYEACIYGIKAALAAGAKNLSVYGESNLIISQTIGAWEVRDERLQMYTEYLQHLLPQFEEVDIKHLPREYNSFTDALANLAVTLTWEEGIKVQYLVIKERKYPSTMINHIVASLVKDEDVWYEDLKKFHQTREYPQGRVTRRIN